MKARVLILHHNFPAQFRFIALDLARNGHDVVFLSECNYVGALEGIRQVTVQEHKVRVESTLDGQLGCAARFRRAMEAIRDEGWYPDVVISHSGWGCGLEVSWVFPRAKRFSYLEWWFRNDSEDYNFDPGNKWWDYNDKMRFKLRRRNLTLAMELSEAHHIITPTRWQQSQLPEVLQTQCEVIHEGVDTTSLFMNTAWRPKNKIRLTYATRGMEPMRAFPEFVQALPPLLEKLPKLEVVIAGDDRVAYGANKPEEGSFGRWARRQLAPWVESGSIRFVGHLPFANYARLLKSSHVHCYLTRPFVASWSLLDAMASGCCIVGSDLEVVREIADPAATAWVDHRRHGQLVDVLEYALKLDPSERDLRGRQQRDRVQESWNRKLSLQRWRGLLEI